MQQAENLFFKTQFGHFQDKNDFTYNVHAVAFHLLYTIHDCSNIRRPIKYTRHFKPTNRKAWRALILTEQKTSAPPL